VTTPQGLACGRLDDLHLRHGLSLTLPDGRRRQVAAAEVLTLISGDG
jgi:hypothetical protein